MRTSNLRSLLYLAAGLGLLVSLFATAEYFDASLRGLCSVNSFFSCSLVDNSGRTTTLGVPDYLWGIGGFLAIFVVGGLAEARPEDVRRAGALVLVTTAGVGLSLYLLYVELAEIHALCVVCAAAYLLGAVAWVAALALLRRTRARARQDGDEAEPTDDTTG
jgi:uncharacterized membrane protein